MAEAPHRYATLICHDVQHYSAASSLSNAGIMAAPNIEVAALAAVTYPCCAVTHVHGLLCQAWMTGMLANQSTLYDIGGSMHITFQSLLTTKVRQASTITRDFCTGDSICFDVKSCWLMCACAAHLLQQHRDPHPGGRQHAYLRVTDLGKFG